jgi:hypothetical protein
MSLRSPSTCTNGSRPRVAIDRDERLGIPEVGDRPDRTFEAESTELVAEIGSERDRGVDAVHDRAPAELAHGSPHVRREPEDALPHDDRTVPPAREHRGLDRAPAVRDHDVDRLEREMTAERTRAEPQGAEAAVGTPGQRRQVDVFAAVEPEAEREDLVGVAQRVEPARELHGHELCAAALAPGDEMQNSHWNPIVARGNRCTVPRPWNPAARSSSSRRRRRASKDRLPRG